MSYEIRVGAWYVYRRRGRKMIRVCLCIEHRDRLLVSPTSREPPAHYFEKGPESIDLCEICVRISDGLLRAVDSPAVG